VCIQAVVAEQSSFRYKGVAVLAVVQPTRIILMWMIEGVLLRVFFFLHHNVPFRNVVTCMVYLWFLFFSGFFVLVCGVVEFDDAVRLEYMGELKDDGGDEDEDD